MAVLSALGLVSVLLLLAIPLRGLLTELHVFDGGCAMEKYGYRLYRDRMWIVGVVAQILDAL